MEIPAPGLRNGHINSILANQGPRAWRVRHIYKRLVPTPIRVTLDGAEATLQGEYCAQAGQARGLVTLIHGWLGDAQSTYLRSATATLFAQGYSVFRLHLRDHGSSASLNREPFLAIRVREVASALRQIWQRFPHASHHLVGYSLGGNIALRTAAGLGEDKAGLQQVIAICPPIDPALASEAISRNAIFNPYFSKAWKRAFQEKIDLFPEYERHRDLLSGENVLALHEAYVPVFSDFPDASSYFRAYTLNGQTLAIPATVIASEDDPCIPVQSLPLIEGLDGVRIERTRHGGHCGFLTRYRSGSWLDQRLLQLIQD